MLVGDGERQLREFAAQAYPAMVTEVVPGGIFHVMGYGHSNASFIIGQETVILVDTLDTDARAERLAGLIAERTDKPVKTIIYTHGHPDHRGGAGVFADSEPEIIAFGPIRPPLARSEQLESVLLQRGGRQFGYDLSDEEAICQGIGMREGLAVGDGVRCPLPPTTVYREAEVRRVIDGVPLTLRAAPGETDDQIFIWMDEHRVLFCGDNYYGCWPNLYAIRGGQYRDVAAWIDSLDLMRQYPAEALLPGHTHPVLGREHVTETLSNFRNAIDHVLRATLTCMDRGMGIEETVAAVHLPQRWAELPYLQEFYGTVAWTVRSIYSGYLGWFDGNPTHLNPLAPTDRARKMIAQMGGEAEVDAAMRRALDDGEPQWGLELADLLLAINPDNEGIRSHKAAGLRTLARQDTSANGRHYYFHCANELAAE